MTGREQGADYAPDVTGGKCQEGMILHHIVNADEKIFHRLLFQQLFKQLAHCAFFHVSPTPLYFTTRLIIENEGR